LSFRAHLGFRGRTNALGHLMRENRMQQSRM
jgi:hypothetical protein